MAIKQKRTSTSNYAWQSSDLAEGQIGLNIADGTLHFKKTNNSIVNLSTGTLPSQTGQAGQYLQTNGTSTDWVAPGNEVSFTTAAGASKPIPLVGVSSGDSLSLATSLTFGTSAEIFTGSNNIGWRDITSDINVKGTGSNNPSWATIRNGISAYSFSATVMQEAWVNFHINHDYALGTPVYLHVHWVNPGTNTGTVRWGFEYSYAKGHGQEAFPASQTVYVEQAASQYTHMIAEISTGILDTVLEPDGIIMVRVFRDATHANDTCTDAVALVMSDVHYQASKWATKNKAPNFNL